MFTDDDRTIIRSLALDETKRALQEARGSMQAETDRQVEAKIQSTLPRLYRLEQWGRHWSGVLAIIVAIPLASAGAMALLQKGLSDNVGTEVKKIVDAPDGPVMKRFKGLREYQGGLAETLGNQVDSATYKSMRFGCNETGNVRQRPVSGIPACPGATRAAVSDEEAQAQSIQELREQSLVFKADRAHQRILLRLTLDGVDSREVLSQVGLEIRRPPLLSVGAGADFGIALKEANLPEGYKFLARLNHGGTQASLLKLYGATSVSDQEPLRVNIDITEFFPMTGESIHTLRFLSQPLPGKAGVSSARFYIHAVVIVTHKLDLPKE